MFRKNGHEIKDKVKNNLKKRLFKELQKYTLIVNLPLFL